MPTELTNSSSEQASRFSPNVAALISVGSFGAIPVLTALLFSSLDWFSQDYFGFVFLSPIPYLILLALLYYNYKFLKKTGGWASPGISLTVAFLIALIPFMLVITGFVWLDMVTVFLSFLSIMLTILILFGQLGSLQPQSP